MDLETSRSALGSAFFGGVRAIGRLAMFVNVPGIAIPSLQVLLLQLLSTEGLEVPHCASTTFVAPGSSTEVSCEVLTPFSDQAGSCFAMESPCCRGLVLRGSDFCLAIELLVQDDKPFGSSRTLIGHPLSSGSSPGSRSCAWSLAGCAWEISPAACKRSPPTWSKRPSCWDVSKDLERMV